jgi:hypothetical protein
LREFIKQVIDKIKQDYPDNQVKVAVDTNKMCLRVARRCTVEGAENFSKKWNSYERLIPLPRDVLNIDTRKVPEGFKLDLLPPGRDEGLSGSPEKNTGTDVSMDVETPPLPPSP